MPPVKPIDEIQKRYSQASGMVDRYISGVETTAKSWKTEALKADAAWKQGTAQAAAAGLFAKGINRTSNEDWKSAAMTKGGERYSGGVTAGVPKYISRVSPYLSIISGIVLPARGPRGAGQNYERVKAIGEKLHAARVARG
uniref:Uncharacterized protein n=1 Tax=viral metagenome TaxID=1070528 RepID=A0A6M3XVM7_9ZZZZ